MAAALIGKKIGMTRVFDDQSRQIPVTVIEAGPCYVTQVKSAESDGYDAVQIGYEDVKARSSTMPKIGHDMKAGVAPKRIHREFRVSGDELENFELGQELTVESLAEVMFVDVIGTSKGKGFQGPMKRHGFKGQLASHGVERKHRSPGAIAGRSANLGTGKPKKGIRMGGHMGAERVTTRSLEVVRTVPEKNLILIKGPVPGPNNGVVVIREAVRLSKVKQSKLNAS